MNSFIRRQFHNGKIAKVPSNAAPGGIQIFNNLNNMLKKNSPQASKNKSIKTVKFPRKKLILSKINRTQDTETKAA